MQNTLDDLNFSNKQIVFESDLSLIFSCKLQTNWWNSVLKKTSLATLIEINESLNWCDICRIQKPKKQKQKQNKTKKKRYTFSSESGFWFHSKKASLFSRFETHFKILSRKQMFLHLSPLIIHQFFSSKRIKEMILFVEEDYGSLISL